MKTTALHPLALTCIILVGAPIAAETGTEPLTHEALWLMKRVGAPVPSPDGLWVVFSVTEPSYEEDGDVTDLWIVPADGNAEPRRLTSGEGSESDPAWSADSRRIAFTAKRGTDEVKQVYVLNFADGGEATRLTDAPLGAGRPRWSPDGRTILFQSAVHPGAMDEEANRTLAEEWQERKSKVRVFDTFPIRRWDRWLDDTRTHLFTVAVEGDGVSRDLLAGTELAASLGFRGRNSRSGDDLDAVWSPDGESILFVATTEAHTAARSRVSTHLHRVAAGGGEPERLTSGERSFRDPVFQPDGRGVCFSVHDDRTEVFFAHNRIGCAAWPWDGEVRILTEGFDRSVRGFALAPDSGSAYFMAFDAGQVKVYSVPIAGGDVEPATDTRGGVYGGLAIPARAPRTILFANWQSATQPQEVVRIDADGERSLLTQLNVERAAALDWQPLREFWFTNGKGRRSHAFVALPPGFDESKTYPVLVMIHGGHASMWRDAISLRWNYHLLARPGFVVVAPEYRGSVGYGLDFTRDILGDPLRGPADDIDAALEEALRRFPFLDGERVAAAGASYGGHLVNWLEATTDRYRGLVSHAGLASLDMQWSTSDVIYHRELMMGAPFWESPEAWLDQSPLARAGSFKTPMLLSIGESDYRVPLNNTIAMWSALQRMNVPGRLLVWPDENHWVMKGENSKVFYEEVAAWLGKWLGEQAPAGTAAGPEAEVEADYTLGTERTHNRFSRTIPPVLRVPSGSVVELWTKEATDGQLSAESSAEDVPNVAFDPIHPLTGPIFVESAEPGDVLAVTLHEIEVGDWGWVGIFPGFGWLADEFDQPYLKTFEIASDATEVRFSDGVTLPLAPFAGVMGVAPDTGELLSTIPPRANGGNMDNKYLTAGTRVYFPVFVEGALFSIGDTHALQGDGEVCGTAVEAPMRIVLGIEVLKGRRELPEPQYETDDYYAVTAFAETIDEAAKKATRYMIDYLVEERGLARDDAYVLCSLAGDLKISEVVDVPHVLVSMHMPKAIFGAH